jgi:L-fucose isomerase
MLRIPVYVHHGSEESLFRPHVWAAFGAVDPIGLAFRAGANFGPIYG